MLENFDDTSPKENANCFAFLVSKVASIGAFIL